jgi:hypothetical protein
LEILQLRTKTSSEIEELRDDTLADVRLRASLVHAVATLEHKKCFLTSRSESDYKSNSQSLGHKLENIKSEDGVKQMAGIKESKPQTKKAKTKSSDVLAQFGL